MLSILALDAYNRGYNVGMNVEGTHIGTALIVSEDYTTDEQAAGFYATAYDWNDGTATQTVISYRGTTLEH